MTESRKGKRAAGKAQTSISLSESLLEKAKQEAEADGRSFSNWLEQLIREKLKESSRPKK